MKFSDDYNRLGGQRWVATDPQSMLKVETIKERNVIFDLDGTLLDSASAILQAFRLAFRECAVEIVTPLNASIIGPPLFDTIAMLAGTNNEHVINNLAAIFQSVYDAGLCCESLPFPGVDHLLMNLLENGHELYLATNKRQVPTQKILSHLNWAPLFSGIYSLDSFTPRLSSKSELLGKISEDLCLDRKNTIYIGDREDDGIAALANGMNFKIVNWGINPTSRTVDIRY